jgi:hypothetical protein
MEAKPKITVALFVLVGISMLTSALAQSTKMPTDPIGGKPPLGSKPSVEKLSDNLDLEAVVALFGESENLENSEKKFN